MLRDITNWIKYKPDRYAISIALEELQSYSSNYTSNIQESKIQEVEIKSYSWSEYLIDKILFCSKERKILLKALYNNNQNLSQVYIYINSSLREDQKSIKSLVMLLYK